MNIHTDEVVWSEALYKMYGLDPSLSPPNYNAYYKLFTPESWEKLSEAIEQAKTKGIPYELELESVYSDGINRWIWTRGEAKKDDIGKIGIDENILNKKGSLTSNERIDIERHPEIGWRLLNSTNEFSELAQFVIHHHEKWDGSGYPNGLKGEAIQLESRIIAVAEAYDAMTSNSSFDKKQSMSEAALELKRCSGTHFDPKVVEVLLEILLSKTGFRTIA